MTRPTPRPRAYQTAFRLPLDVVARLDAVAARRSRPGARVTRTDVAREALAHGLDAIDPPTPNEVPPDVQ